MKTRIKFILWAFIAGALVWVVDAFLGYFMFYKGESLWGLAFSRIPYQDIYLRSLIVISFLAYGIIMGKVVTRREKTEKAFHEAETRYKTLLDNAEDAILLMKGYVFVDCNKKALEIFKCKRKDIVGKTPIDISPDTQPDGIPTKEKVPEIMDSVISGEARKFYWLHKRVGGEVFHAEVSLSRMELEDAAYTLAILRDITDRVKAQDELIESKAFADSMIASLPGIFYMYDDKLDFVRWNENAAKISGYTEEEIRRMHPLDFFVEEDKEIALKTITKAMQRGSASVEARILTKSGQVIPFFFTGVSVELGGRLHVMGIGIDVSERQKAEKALRDSLQMSANIVESIPSGLFIYRYEAPDKLYLEEANPKAIALTGKDLKDIKGKEFNEIWPEAREKGITDLFLQTPITGESVVTEEIDYRDEFLEGAFRVNVFNMPENKVGIAFEDITERKRVEQELEMYRKHLEERVEQRTAELQEANKELESFSYSVSHDLRAPLRAINGFSGILEDEYNKVLDKEGKRLLGVIKNDTVKMAQLIDDLLEYSRLGRHAILEEDVDMKRLAESEADKQKIAFSGREIDIKVGEMPKAKGDHILLEQVMANLLSNSIKYTEKKDAPKIEVGGDISENENVYYVKDNGVGFNEKYAGKLFEVFQRLHSDEEYSGTGVGLAIVQRAVQKHGGRVWAEGKTDEGATFYFALPRK